MSDKGMSDEGEWTRPLETQVFGAFGNNLRLELCSSFCAGCICQVLIFLEIRTQILHHALYMKMLSKSFNATQIL
jgi:hypothetical protein